MNYRKEIIDRLIPYFKKDDRYHLLIGDMGFTAIDKMKAKMPDRMTNCGIMEQGMVGIAAGMALSGKIPIIYSIINFLCFRALEQIRNDVVLQNLNVKFIGTGANDYFDFLGKSHCCGWDDIKIFDLIHLAIFDYQKEVLKHVDIDFDNNDPVTNSIVDPVFIRVFENWITSDKAGYIRV